MSVGDVAACRVCVCLLCSLQGGREAGSVCLPPCKESNKHTHTHRHDMLPHHRRT